MKREDVQMLRVLSKMVLQFVIEMERGANNSADPEDLDPSFERLVSRAEVLLVMPQTRRIHCVDLSAFGDREGAEQALEEALMQLVVRGHGRSACKPLRNLGTAGMALLARSLDLRGEGAEVRGLDGERLQELKFSTEDDDGGYEVTVFNLVEDPCQLN